MYTHKIPMCVNPACAFAATDKNNMIAFPQAGIAYCFISFSSNFIPVKAMIPPDNIFATKPIGFLFLTGTTDHKKLHRIKH